MECKSEIRILLIATSFPPERSGGIGRPYSLFKYLPDSGIKVDVITKNTYGYLNDEKGIFRFDTFDTWRDGKWFSLKRFLKVYSYLINKLFCINQDFWWVNSVTKNYDKIIRNTDYDLIYASFPGVDALKLALKLKKKLEISLIVEFRDGLSFESIYRNVNLIQKRNIKKLESKVVRKSSSVVTIGKNLSNFFINEYGNKVFTVFNGYEDEDFEFNDEIISLEKNDLLISKMKKIEIFHFGSLGASRSADRKGLFNALAKLKVRRLLHEDVIVFKFIGRIEDKERKVIESFELGKMIEFIPPMDKKPGLAYLKDRADFLLFYGVPNETTIISSKLLEYIKLGIPIIGICKGNEAESIISKTNTGEVCDFDEQSIIDLLLRVVNSEIEFNPNQDVISNFNRRKQTKEISNIIKRALIT